jgi:mannose/fructose/N-acetylgalactosamine-specific phosphotransferase system component IIB
MNVYMYHLAEENTEVQTDLELAENEIESLRALRTHGIEMTLK